MPSEQALASDCCRELTSISILVLGFVFLSIIKSAKKDRDGKDQPNSSGGKSQLIQIIETRIANCSCMLGKQSSGGHIASGIIHMDRSQGEMPGIYSHKWKNLG